MSAPLPNGGRPRQPACFRGSTRATETCFVVRYESSVDDPATTFQGICVDEPFEAKAVEEARPDIRRWPIDPHLWGAIVPSTKEWRDHISTEEAIMVQNLTASIMRRLGYQPYPMR
jgi:hypothetical protein